MKKKIRKNIFETNSSSCHTLSLAQDNQNISVDEEFNKLLKDEKLYIYPQSYGWVGSDILDKEGIDYVEFLRHHYIIMIDNDNNWS